MAEHDSRSRCAAALRKGWKPNGGDLSGLRSRQPGPPMHGGCGIHFLKLWNFPLREKKPIFCGLFLKLCRQQSRRRSRRDEHSPAAIGNRTPCRTAWNPCCSVAPGWRPAHHWAFSKMVVSLWFCSAFKARYLADGKSADGCGKRSMRP